jgi:phosphate transport system substrate-binding protein
MRAPRFIPAVPVLRALVPLTVLSCLLFVGTSCSRFADEETATKGRLTVCASESHLELIQAEAEQFTSLYQEAKVTVFGATTREAIMHLLNDSVSVVVLDRTLNAEEEQVVKKAKLKLERIEVALDAVAVVVNSLNDVRGISKETLKDILTRKVTDWSQISGSGLSGPVELALTGRNSGTYELIKDHFFGLSEDIQASVVLPSQKEVLEYVAKHPQAIGLVSLASFRSPSVQFLSADSTSAVVRALSFAGQDSTGKAALFKLHQAHIHLGKYPLSYSVYIYVRKESDLAAGFVGFIAGPVGQKIILNWGLVPVTMPVRIVTLT